MKENTQITKENQMVKVNLNDDEYIVNERGNVELEIHIEVECDIKLANIVMGMTESIDSVFLMDGIKQAIVNGESIDNENELLELMKDITIHEVH